jgi:hypothetical protein
VGKIVISENVTLDGVDPAADPEAFGTGRVRPDQSQLDRPAGCGGGAAEEVGEALGQPADRCSDRVPLAPRDPATAAAVGQPGGRNSRTHSVVVVGHDRGRA